MSRMLDTPLITVIDDDRSQLKLIETILSAQRKGWSVRNLQAVHRSDGFEPSVQQLSAEGVPAMILLDYRLQGGVYADHVVRDFAQVAPVVVMTGSDAEHDAEICLSAGAAAVVNKPFNLSEAEEMLRVCDRVLAAGSDPGPS